jgi:hypothetical protein
MAGRKTTVFAIYALPVSAENSIDSLTRSDFPISDVSVLFPDPRGPAGGEPELETMWTDGDAEGSDPGIGSGGMFGLLAGIGTMSIPGVGPVIAAGPIVSTLAGTGTRAAVDGIAGTLVGLGIPESFAKRYEGRIQEGGILISVHCDTLEEISQAKDIMQRTGGEAIMATGESPVDISKPAYRTASGGKL